MTWAPCPGCEQCGTCRYCGGPDEEDGKPTGSGTCGECWYGMRLEPDEFEARLKRLGRSAEYVGGCVPLRYDPATGREIDIGGTVVLACRNPYEPKEQP